MLEQSDELHWHENETLDELADTLLVIEGEEKDDEESDSSGRQQAGR